MKEKERDASAFIYFILQTDLFALFYLDNLFMNIYYGG